MKHLLFLALFSSAIAMRAQNPYLPLWEHVPDGEPRLFADPDNPGSMRVYIIGSHDTHRNKYCGVDVRMWSAPADDLSNWRDEGPLFTHKVDGKWDTMYAPDLVETRTGSQGRDVTYWLFPHSRGYRRVGTVCRSTRPNGPFEAVNLTDDGRECLPGSLLDFDPAVYIDQDSTSFRAYAYYGFRHSTAVELDPDKMYCQLPGSQLHDYFIPASETYGQLRDPEGTVYADIMPGENLADFNFFEASSIRLIGNKYVMIYSGYSGPDYGLSSSNSTLRYAYGDTPLGPWRAGGVLVDSRGIVPNQDGSRLVGTNSGHNTHGSMLEINGQWYVFYHRPPRGFGYARQSMVAPVHVEWDKRSVADGGQVRITGYDPFAKNRQWTARAADGNEYRGAEVTSEGFQIFGLPPYAYYSAGLACYMSNPGLMQDNFDVWNNSMDLVGMKSGDIAGFKYFGFGGLKSSKNGVQPFLATSKGDGTKLGVRLTPTGSGVVRLRVMLDGPYANATWKGSELGTITVPASAARQAQTVSIDVPQVEGLKGKHAIYLIVDEGECTLHGLGFYMLTQPLRVPTVPRLAIVVDGQRLTIPDQPVSATAENGYTMLNHYQLTAQLKADSQIRATSTDPSVSIKVSPVADGRATVEATWRGLTKVFLIN